MTLRLVALASAVLVSAPAHAQVEQGNQPPLIQRPPDAYAEPSFLVQWIRDHVPSENIHDLATMIPGSAVVWVDRSTVKKDGGLGQAWQHWEIYDAETAAAVGFRSFRLLQRYECEEGGTVHIEGWMYPGTDLSGTPVQFPDPKGDPDAANWKALSFILFDDLRLTVCDGIYFSDEDAPYR
ncbi:MAG: hypothetical protein Q8O54_03045 [Brevundimonas sp.]|nr:hypothetical protein [Brevundimonas sp.]